MNFAATWSTLNCNHDEPAAPNESTVTNLLVLDLFQPASAAHHVTMATTETTFGKMTQVLLLYPSSFNYSAENKQTNEEKEVWFSVCDDAR